MFRSLAVPRRVVAFAFATLGLGAEDPKPSQLFLQGDLALCPHVLQFAGPNSAAFPKLVVSVALADSHPPHVPAEVSAVAVVISAIVALAPHELGVHSPHVRAILL